MAKKRDFEALARRRLAAYALLEKGVSQAEVARRTQASRQSVSRWNQARKAGGKTALQAAGRAGRKPRLGPVQETRLMAVLAQGPEAAGFSTPLWTLGLVTRVIAREFGVKYHASTALRVLRDRLKWSCQKPVGRARERK